MRVKGRGPTPCDIAIVGEGPGWQEDKVGRPFVGKTGDEIDRFLDGVHLPRRREVFLTNLYREYKGKNIPYTGADLARDERDLLEELERVLPFLIVTLGRESTRWFLGDVDIEAVHGIPYWRPKGGLLGERLPRAVVFPIVHPAAALHNPDMAGYVVSGFQELSRYLRGTSQPRTLFDDPYPEANYEEITSQFQLEAALCLLKKDTPLAIDTEGWPYRPLSLQFSYEQGYAYCINADRRDLLSYFHRYCARQMPHLVFHSALYDLGMGRALQCSFEALTFDDTMIMAHLLQIEPKGLKPLCLRHCNMRMQSYEDVMGDISERLIIEWLTKLRDLEQHDYIQRCESELLRLQTTPYTDDKGRRHQGRCVKKVPQLSKLPLHKTAMRCLQSKNVRKLWNTQESSIRQTGALRLGSPPEATLDDIPTQVAITYKCRDADGTGRLARQLLPRIDALGLREIYDLELRATPFVERMQWVGLKPDLGVFAALSQRLEIEIDIVAAQLRGLTGIATFNANSGNQVASYLFDTLGLPMLKRTESGRGSTNDKIMEALEHEHPEVREISACRTFRELYKLKYTFVDCLPSFTDRYPRDGRIHTTFRTTSVVTGRLSASDPNVLALPEHGKFAPDFKRGWIAEPGRVLCAWDESQVELRGLAHLSQDPVLIQAYTYTCNHPPPCERDACVLKKDIHASLAHRIFGVMPSKQDKHTHRFPVKEVNFGIPNGMQAHGLRLALRAKGLSDISTDDAQHWLDETNDLYKGVPVYQDRMIAEARRNGFIRCLSGRIRYIGGIKSRDSYTRGEAERAAFSTPIQASAADIMKQAEATIMEEVLPYFWSRNIWVEPILQIHDSIKMECEEGVAQELHSLIVEAMTNVEKGFSVPLAVEGEYGLNMNDMRPFDVVLS
jgi:uracil-DNA glycosylase family 4